VHGLADTLGNLDSGRVDSVISRVGDSIVTIDAGIVESRDEYRDVGAYIGESRESIEASRDSLETSRDGVAAIGRLEAAN
jgi:hypothetical protein